MAESTEYKTQLLEVEEIAQPDNLIVGFDHKAAGIKLTVAGEYKRGQVLMSGSEGYVVATGEGYASSNCCILCDDVTVPEGSYVEAAGYFAGTFNASAVTLWEDADLEAVRPVLRSKNLWLV